MVASHLFSLVQNLEHLREKGGKTSSLHLLTLFFVGNVLLVPREMLSHQKERVGSLEEIEFVVQHVICRSRSIS